MRTFNYGLSIFLLAGGVCFSSMAHASLVSRPNGMVYDTDLNITWMADTNLFATFWQSNGNLLNDVSAANRGVAHDTPNFFDNGTYTLQGDEVLASSGTVLTQWWEAQAFIVYLNGITYNGYSDWRLPKAVPTVGVNNSFESASELGHLY